MDGKSATTLTQSLSCRRWTEWTLSGSASGVQATRAATSSSSPQSTLRRIAPQALPNQRDAWDADRLERYKGNPPKMVPMVVAPAAGGRGLTRECGRVGLLHREKRAGRGEVAV